MEQNITMHQGSRRNIRRTVVGGFIAAHGAMHALLLSTPRPDGGVGNFVTRGGEIPIGEHGLQAGTVEVLGAALVIIAAAGLVLSALLYLREARTWERCLMTSSAMSMATLVLFWNDWMIMGPVISGALFVLALRSVHAKEVGA
jgi:hypothetical protein